MFRKKSLKKFLIPAILLSFCMSFSIYTVAEAPSEPTETVIANNDDVFVLGGIRPPGEVMSRAAFVYELTTDTLVYSKNPDERIYPASTVKIMTALLVLENVRNLDTIVEYPTVLNDEFHTSNSNFREPALAGFANRQNNLSVRDVLYGLMLPSGCEAANILAHHVGKGNEPLERVEDFVRQMNAAAERLGMTNTNFTNAHGLFEPDNYSTVRDLFIVTRYAFSRYPIVFPNLVSARQYEMPPNTNPGNSGGYTVRNTNQLIQPDNPYTYEYASGVKTGGLPYIRYQNADGSWGPQLSGLANLVSVAERDGFRYVIVSAEAPWLPSSQRGAGQTALHHAFNDHIALYNWAFATFENATVLRRTDPITSMKVVDGTANHVVLFPQMEDEFRALLPRGLDANSIVHRELNLESNEVSAPVEAGEIFGVVELWLAGQVLRTFPLIAGESVEKTPAAERRSWLRETFFNEIPPAEGTVADPDEEPVYRLKTGYLLLIIGTGVLVIALIVLSYIRNHRKKQAEAMTLRKKKSHNRRIRL
jgi:D-alanyl-D-alanine carboxypeptidase (penicillin-binding protein 5/6)